MTSASASMLIRARRPCLPVAGFDVGYVRDSAPEHGRALVDHALQNEGVDAVVGPTVSNHGFNHEEREVALSRRFTRVRERGCVKCGGRTSSNKAHVLRCGRLWQRARPSVGFAAQRSGAHRFSWARIGIQEPFRVLR